MKRGARRSFTNAPSDKTDGMPARRRGLLCRLGFHEAEPEGMFRGAHFHSHCRGCGAAMIRRGACWSMAPKPPGRPR